MKEKIGEESMDQISGGASYQIDSRHGEGYSLTRAEEDYLTKNNYKVIHESKNGTITSIEVLTKDMIYKEANPKEVIKLIKDKHDEGEISDRW